MLVGGQEDYATRGAALILDDPVMLALAIGEVRRGWQQITLLAEVIVNNGDVIDGHQVSCFLAPHTLR